MWVVRDREAGNIICNVRTMTEGYDMVKMFEQADFIEGDYVPDFYEVANIPE